MPASEHVDLIARDLPGGVRADVVTIDDAEGTTTRVQLTVLDEPLDVSTIWDLSDALRTLALDLMGRR